MRPFATLIALALVFSMLLFAGCDRDNDPNGESNEQLAVAENSECADGTCPLPVPMKEPDLTNPDIRFDTGECFTFVVDDDAVAALGATRQEVMLAIYEARRNGKYNSIEELLNLTVKISGKEVPIKSLVKISK